MSDFLAELRRQLRALCAKPTYLIVSVFVLSAGIASQLAIIAVIDALLIRPPSAQAPEQLVFVPSSLPGGSMSYPDFKDIAERNTVFDATFAYAIAGRSGVIVGDEFVTGTSGLVTGGLFSALGVAPEAGRLIEPGDDLENAAPVAVISHDFGTTMKLSLGSVVKVNGVAATVVGILPADYRSFDRSAHVDLWLPMATAPSLYLKSALTNRAYQFIKIGGRLKAGVTLTQANAQLGIVAGLIARENPVQNHGMTMAVVSFSRFRFQQDGSARVMVLLGALVGALFALAFTNFFALTMLRLLTRRRELAVKVAIGATRTHVARWLLGEVAIVMLLAVAAGWGLAHALLRTLALDAKVHTMLQTADVHLDARAGLIVGLAVLGCAGGVWLAALRHASRVDLLSAIKETAVSPRRKTAFAGLFSVQLAMAFFLVTTALSFASALRSAATRHYPFRTDNLLLFDVSFRHLGIDGKDRIPAADKFVAALREVPGVTAIGATSTAPMSVVGWTNVIVNERDPALEPDKGLANRFVVTNDFFETAGIAVQEGRAIDAHDIVSGTKVAVINRSLAKRYWENESPLGKTFRPWENGQPYTIVGVVADIPTGTTTAIWPSFYLPWAQSSHSVLTFHVAVERDSPALRQQLTERLRTVWPYRTVPVLRSMHDQIDASAADLATAVRVILWLAGLATAVTAIGLYFFSAYTATQSMKDAAVRQALGAQPRDILAAHLARYRIALIAGIGAGVAVLFGARYALSRTGLDLTSLRPIDLLGAGALLLAIALIGLCVPVRKIMRLDIVKVLSDGG